LSPEEIRITDLARPIYSALERQAMDAAPIVVMDLRAVLDKASATTGLSDFGPPDFRERLALWLQCFDDDTGLNRLGRAGAFDQCVRYAMCRLRVEDLLARHPEIAEIKLDRPLIIAGLPRSGTTHLVNILGSNPELRSMPLWETMEPVPALDELSFDASESNPRYRRSLEMWHILTNVLQYWSAMHEMAPDHIHEEVELQCLDFSSYMPQWLARVPDWQDYYFNHDQTPHYAYARKVIQAMTWLKGPDRWLMKSPPNMENLLPLFATYPDATVVITHRDPVAVIQSTVAMVAYWDRIRRIQPDLPGLANQWIDRIERLLRACVRDRDRVPEGQVIDVLFHQYMADQRSTVEQIYARAQLPRSPEADRRTNDYLNANPRGKLGRVVYDLAGDFGVDVAALRRRFQFYYDRFPVRPEPTLGDQL
jgi:hypothetical protein